MSLDPAIRDHKAWLGYLQPDGLVVSPAALVDAQVLLDANAAPLQQRFLDYVEEIEDDGEVTLAITSLPEVLTGFLEWPAKYVAGLNGAAIPDELKLPIKNFGETLEPTHAFRDPKAAENASPWMLLIEELPRGTDFDVAVESAEAGWSASATRRFERLLREAGVPIGLQCNGTQFRLIYAPRGENTGTLTFNVSDMVEVAGRPILAAFEMLLSSYRLLSAPTEARLPGILQKSREYQARVSTTLAKQVLDALYELLRGFQVAHDHSHGALLKDPLVYDPDAIYGGLLTTLMRLVFLLYAEDRGLMPGSDLYVRNYSIHSLFERLRNDAERYPDTMDHRYGAWAQLVALFRAVHYGSEFPRLKMPARQGHLFNPDRFPFLEGSRGEGNRRATAPANSNDQTDPSDPSDLSSNTPRLPLIADGVIYRVLDKLLLLKGERLSYRTLDVEQIGSVYETMMGFKLQTAQGQTVALKPAKKMGAPVPVNVEELVAVASKDRVKWILEQTDYKLPKSMEQAVKAAKAADEMLAALEKRIARNATPQPVPAGTMLLMPTDERRKTGSHYTPRSLTEPIVRTTLEPVLQQLGDHPSPDQILELKVCDPAMGSGAFLVEACRQLADQLVEAWAYHGYKPHIPEDEDEVLFARRLVAQRCLYGVDRNPMAVDLSKLSLWLATLAKDHPFTFLDHALRAGDSLVGLTRKQIAAFHWEPAPQQSLSEQWIRERIENATKERRHILNAGDDMLPAVKAQRLKLADQALNPVRRTGDAVIAAFFSEAKKNKRQEARDRLAHAHEMFFQSKNDFMLLKPLDEAVAKLRAEPFPVTPFHWEIEFPEVFSGEKAGFDSIVGNPPFAGKNTLINSNRLGYLDWLLTTHDKSHGNADVVAHFFRRAFGLNRTQGTFGLIATNTIAQGDTRTTGLTYLCNNHATIYHAKRRYKWPGLAAVIVSVVHVAKGEVTITPVLDRREVPRVTAFLFHDGGHEDPVTLQPNLGRSFIGHFVCGSGFTFDDSNTTNGSNSIATMEGVIKRNPNCSERIFPYIGGEEVLSDPKQSYQRFVVNFEELSEEQARHWPELMAILEEKVKPGRVGLPPKNSWNRTIAAKWWLWGAYRKELREATNSLKRILFVPNLASHFVAVFLSTDIIVGAPHNVLALPDFGSFTTIQARIHECWARFFGSSLEDRFRYTPTACFETFPFPEGFDSNPTLEAAGKEYYEFRADLMVRNDEGLTKTYNRFHDPEDASPDIQKLRDLHDAMDRAVLDAYGWTDLQATCEFLLDYEDEDDEDPSSPTGYAGAGTGRTRKKKKPWRYRWPDDLRDEVLARLLKLNAERAEEERRTGQTAEGGGRKRVGKRTTPPSIDEALPDGAWARPKTSPGGDQIAALAAALKGGDEPMPIRDLRLTALLAMKPALLTPSLRAPEAALWRRLIGPEAESMLPGVPESDTVEDQAWGQAVRQLRGTGHLIEDVSAQTWAPGPGLDAIATSGWPEGRVQFVMDVLRQRSAEELIVALPSTIQEWINAKAA